MNRNDISKIWLTDNAVWIELKTGERGAEYFSDYSRLLKASPSERERYVVSHFGLHWPDIDEDLSFSGFFRTSNARHKNIHAQ